MSPPPFFRPCRDTIKTSHNQLVAAPLRSPPTVPPGCPPSLPHAPPRMPRYFVPAPSSLQTPVERSERVAGWAVRARANPLSLRVWHFTLRFVLPGVGLAIPLGCPHSLSHAPPRMPRYFVRAPFCLQTPVERSERVACWAVRGHEQIRLVFSFVMMMMTFIGSLRVG